MGNTPGRYVWQVRMRSPVQIEEWLKDYLGMVDVCDQDDESSVLTGALPDLPAIYGLIIKLRDAGIDILSLQVERVEI